MSQKTKLNSHKIVSYRLDKCCCWTAGTTGEVLLLNSGVNKSCFTLWLPAHNWSNTQMIPTPLKHTVHKTSRWPPKCRRSIGLKLFIHTKSIGLKCLSDHKAVTKKRTTACQLKCQPTGTGIHHSENNIVHSEIDTPHNTDMRTPHWKGHCSLLTVKLTCHTDPLNQLIAQTLSDLRYRWQRLPPQENAKPFSNNHM